MSWLCGSSLLPPLAVAAGLRVGLWAVVLVASGPDGLVAADTPSYLEPGRNLLLHGAFQTAGLAEIGRTPGYPLFLALASLHGWAAAALLQVAISLLSVWLVARLARAAGLGRQAAKAAAWCMALEPLATVYSVRLLSETLFCLLLLVSLERMACFLRSLALPAVAASGAALAAAIFVRPAACYLPLLWAVGLAAICVKQQRRSVLWKAPALFLVITLPLLALWQMRNATLTGFSGFSSIATRNAYFYSAAAVEARASDRTLAQVQSTFGYADDAAYVERHPEQAHWNQAARLSFMQAESRRILLAHWPDALLVHLEGSAVAVFSPGVAELAQMLGALWSAPDRVVEVGPLRSALGVARAQPVRALLMAAFELVLLVFYGFALRGVLRAGLAKPVLVLFLGTAIYFIAISGGVQAVARFRMPVMPLVCVLAGAGLTSVRKQAQPED